MLQVIVKGKLDYADREYVIREGETLKTRYLYYYLDAYLGKTIVISLEEEEPILNENPEALMALA